MSNKEFDWFDHAKNQRKLKLLMWAICILSVIAEPLLALMTHHPREAHFGWDGWVGFYAVLGFASCAVAILVAKALGVFLKKDEDYYDHD